jgi:hypothetical protein
MGTPKGKKARSSNRRGREEEERKDVIMQAKGL